MARQRGRSSVTPFGRDYRKAPRFGMGLPPRRPRSRWRRRLARVLDPVFYLKAVITVGTFALILLPLGADALSAVMKSAQSDAGACRVLAVIDGDTISIWCADRRIERARLTGLDAPELFSPGCPSELLAAQQATWALRAMIFRAKSIEMNFDGQDRYDRALVGLRLDGSSVATRMINAGHARAYQGGVRKGWCKA
jgi:micrococcal nuclease